MPDPNFVLLYVEDPARSAAFYAGILGRDPVEASPTFAMFAANDGLMLGLWARRGVEPAPAALPGSSELAISVGGTAEVDRLHDAWKAGGIVIAQAPTEMDFGYTFVALDPDAHRLRVFAPR